MINKSFNIPQWAAWAPGLNTPAQWRQWAAKPELPSEKADIKTPSIPAISRRRCSKLAKISIELASQATTTINPDYSIFCSQHGDLSSTEKLMADICQQQPLSPTQFTQSVHNSAVGLYTILNKQQSNSTFISAGKNTFKMALIEALAWLNQYENNRVLLVMAETYFPDLYKDLGISPEHEYGVAFVLDNHTAEAPSFTEDDLLVSHNNMALPPALGFLAWLLQHSNNQASV
jgi:hypothetical protein